MFDKTMIVTTRYKKQQNQESGLSGDLWYWALLSVFALILSLLELL